jgi:polyisoprenyl-phosphate glycosyltransferase
MKRIAIVAPVFNEEAVLPHFAAAITSILDALEPRYAPRLVLVDDGSRDRSWTIVQQLAAGDSRISGIRLTRNFGHQQALTCGYELSDADAVVSIDSDLQDPPAVILDMVAAWECGAKVVLAVRRTRVADRGFKRLTAASYYRLMSLIGEGATVEQSGDFRLLDRRVVDALNLLPERHRYIRGLVGWLGFETSTVEFDRAPRAAGRTKYPIQRMICLALDGVVSLSFVPLRLAYVLACIGSLPFLGYLVYNLVLHVAYGVRMVPGWPSLILAVTAFGVANLLMMGVLGEYTGRIYSEVKRRPLFIVSDTCGRRFGGDRTA